MQENFLTAVFLPLALFIILSLVLGLRPGSVENKKSSQNNVLDRIKSEYNP